MLGYTLCSVKPCEKLISKINRDLSAIGIGAEIQHVNATNFGAKLCPRWHVLATSSGGQRHSLWR